MKFLAATVLFFSVEAFSTVECHIREVTDAKWLSSIAGENAKTLSFAQTNNHWELIIGEKTYTTKASRNSKTRLVYEMIANHHLFFHYTKENLNWVVEIDATDPNMRGAIFSYAPIASFQCPE